MQTPEKTSNRTNTKHKIDLTKATSWTLLEVGVAALIISIIYASSILTFIGLGLLF
jgi:type II secretory pathway pseudopilin PulG